MIRFLREFWYAFQTRKRRFELAYSLVAGMPGNYGVIVRGALATRQFATVGENLYVGNSVRFRNPESIHAGSNVSFGDETFLQAGGGLTFGDDVVVGPRVMVWTQNHRSDRVDIPINLQGYEYKPVEIGDDCWIGANAFIMPGVKLPRGCVVAAHSVVGVKAYREYSLLAGYPARVIGYRKKDDDKVLAEKPASDEPVS